MFTIRAIGFPELVLVVLFGVFLILPVWKIFAKAGYPGYWSLGLCIPLLNIFLWYYLAFSQWPVLRELRALRQRAS